MKRRSQRPAPAGGLSAQLRVELLEPRILLSDVGFRPPAPVDGSARAEAAIVSLNWKGRTVEARQNEFILRLDAKPTASADAFSRLQAAIGKRRDDLKIIRTLSDAGTTVLLEAPATVDAQGLKKSLKGLRGFRYVEPNFVYHADVLPNDPLFGEQWGLHNTGQQGGGVDIDIDAPEAWDITRGDGSVVVGVVDTGVDYTHPDLASNIYTNPGEIPDNGVDDDRNGFIDDVHGWDFVGDGDNDPIDEHGHGTHVAGIIAASGKNSVGISGVNWDAKIMPLRFLDDQGFGDSADAVDAIRYANMMRSRGVNIRLTNNSWAGGAYSQALYDAVSAAGEEGMLFVAAAGNFGLNADNSPNYPSAFDLPNVISVAAIDRNGSLATFSNYGARSVDLGAPGVDVLSTVPFRDTFYSSSTGYRLLSGTSMAAPHVSGVAALAWSVAPDVTAATVRDALLSAGDASPLLAGKTVTGRQLNALGTLRALGMRVVSSTPEDGGIITDRLTDFTVRFTFPVLADAAQPGGLQASDFRVNGIAATSVIKSADNSATFHFGESPVSREGKQVMSMAAAAVRRADDGAPLHPWAATFRYDVLPLGVSSASLGEGSRVAAPAFALRLDFNEFLDPATVGPDDLALPQGFVSAARLVGNRSVQYFINGLRREGPLQIDLPAGALADSNGNPNSPYRLTVDVDRDTVSFPNEFVRSAPLGSLAWQADPVDGAISYESDVDRYTIDLLADQVLSAWLESSEDLTAILTLESPDGSVLASGISAGAGNQVLVQAAISASGRYTIAVSGAGGTSGDYRLHAAINSVEEAETHGGANNDTAATFQPLTQLLARRGSAGALITVKGSQRNDSDFYSLPLNAGDHLEVRTTKLNGLGTLAGIELQFDGVPQAAAIGDGFSDAVTGYIAPASGLYLIHLPGSTDRLNYALSVGVNLTLDREPNDDAALALSLPNGLPSVGFVSAGTPPLNAEIEPNDDGDPDVTPADFRRANDLSDTFAPIFDSTYTADIPGTIASRAAVDVDYFRFNARPGDQLLAKMTRSDPSGELDPYLRLYDRDGTQLVADDDSGEGNNASLVYSGFAYTGEYYIAAEGLRLSVGDYHLTATLQTPHLTTSRDDDIYRFTANAGDAIHVDATPLATGPASTIETSPVLTLLEDGGETIVAPTDSHLSFSAPHGGTFQLRVSARPATSGEYQVTITGATAAASLFAVKAIDPADGSTVGPRQRVVIDFSNPVLLSTLDPDDVLIDGSAASGFVVQDGDSVAFTLPSIAPGPHTVSLPAGGITDLNGTSLTPFSSQFSVDSSGPRVVSASIQPGQTVQSGTVVFTAQFSEPLNAAALDAADVELRGVASGLQRGTLSYDQATRTIAVSFSNLSEDVYTLRLISSDSAFTDIVGNRLDGESPLSPGAASGDGKPGGDYVLTFVTDDPVHAFAPLDAVAPAGLSIYESIGSSLIGSADDSDVFDLTLSAGQPFSVVVTPSDDLAPEVELIDSAGQVVGSAVALAGRPALLTGRAAVQGHFALRLSGAGGTMGRAKLKLSLDAHDEAEDITRTPNDTLATPQDMEPAETPLDDQVSRAAVRGSLSPAATAGLSSDFEGLSLGSNWSTNSSSGGGRIRLLGSPAAYEGNQALWMDTAAGTPTLNEAVWTVDLRGVQRPILNFAHASADDEVHPFAVEAFVGHAKADGIALSVDGIRWYVVWRAPAQARGIWTTESVDLQKIADAAGIALGSSVHIKFQQYDDRDMPNDGRGWDNVSITSGVEGDRQDWYSFTLNANQLATAVLFASGDVKIDLFDRSATLRAAGGVGPTNFAKVVDAFKAPAGGRYYIRVSGVSGEYTLGVVKGAAFDQEPNDTPAGAQDLGNQRAVLGHLGAASGVAPASADPDALAPAALPTLPLALIDGDGFVWDIQSDGSILDGTDDAFDGGLAHVGFTGPGPVSLEQQGREVAIGPVTINSVQVTRKIYVPADAGFARYLEIISNPSDTTVGYLVRVSSNLGSDNSTVVVGTSSGDAAFTVADNWIVTDDADDGSGDPTLVHVFAGAGARERPAYAALYAGDLEYDYSLELAPGQTRIIMHFAAQNVDRAAALAKVTTLNELGLSATAGMTSQELQAVANFNLNNPSDFYRKALAPGETVRLRTLTPGDADPIDNALDAKIEIRDETGKLVASDDNSASDGRNVDLTFTSAAGGVYTFAVVATNATSGEYLLRIDPAPPPAPLAPTLLAQSDSGVSASDRVTNFNNAEPGRALLFEVTGVVPGAMVTLYVDGSPIGQAIASGSTVTLPTSGGQKLQDGNHVFTASQQLAGRVQSAASLASTVTIDTRAPNVARLLMRGTTWAATYFDALRAQGLGDGGVTAGTGDVLPWTNLDQVALSFDEPIRAGAGIATLNVQGLGGAYAVSGFALDTAGNRAIYTLAKPLRRDRVSIRFTGGLTDLAGNAVPAGTLAMFDVLPGDVNHDGAVTAADLVSIRNRLGVTSKSLRYRAVDDLDGNGAINAVDVQAVRTRLGTTIPASVASKRHEPGKVEKIWDPIGRRLD